MSIRKRSVVGALLFFGGLLVIAYGGVAKSSDRIKFEYDVAHNRAKEGLPPSYAYANVIMIIGGVLSAAGGTMIAFAARDMISEVGAAGARSEQALQRELLNPKRPKPPT